VGAGIRSRVATRSRPDSELSPPERWDAGLRFQLGAQVEVRPAGLSSCLTRLPAEYSALDAPVRRSLILPLRTRSKPSGGADPEDPAALIRSRRTPDVGSVWWSIDLRTRTGVVTRDDRLYLARRLRFCVCRRPSRTRRGRASPRCWSRSRSCRPDPVDRCNADGG
jgi:hypothetical protein